MILSKGRGFITAPSFFRLRNNHNRGVEFNPCKQFINLFIAQTNTTPCPIVLIAIMSHVRIAIGQTMNNDTTTGRFAQASRSR
jgi:hypothetical protein